MVKAVKVRDDLFDDGIVRNKDRISRTAEIMTPMVLVNEMLDSIVKAGSDVLTNPYKNICEPCFGNGQFIIGILNRRLSNGMTPLQAISTLYGIELMPDNVEVTHKRVYDLLGDDSNIRRAVKHNLVQGDALNFDYDNWCSK